MTFASTRCPGSAVSLLCTVWGRALEALALLMFVKGKNTAFNQSMGHGPPLDRQDCKIEAGPPLQVGHHALGSKSPDILGEKWDKI